jgi:hypothetical protein
VLFGGVVNHWFSPIAAKPIIFNYLTVSKLKEKERPAVGVKSLASAL